MNRISNVGSLLKKIYRLYSLELLSELQKRGFTDLRPSFLELLSFICHKEGASIKEVGRACGLKKQTMTSHLNELEKRKYVVRKVNTLDKREQNIFLTENGQKFKDCLTTVISQIEQSYIDRLGEFEFEKVEKILETLYREFSGVDTDNSLKDPSKDRYINKIQSFRSEISSLTVN